MIVKKQNRVVNIDPLDLDAYLTQGYDQVKLNAETKEYEVVTRATGGRTFTLAEYNAVADTVAELEKENGDLLARIDELEKSKSKK